jgi:hypothetical protein
MQSWQSRVGGILWYSATTGINWYGNDVVRHTHARSKAYYEADETVNAAKREEQVEEEQILWRHMHRRQWIAKNIAT